MRGSKWGISDNSQIVIFFSRLLDTPTGDTASHWAMVARNQDMRGEDPRRKCLLSVLHLTPRVYLTQPEHPAHLQQYNKPPGNRGGTGYSGACIRGAAPANLAIPVPQLFRRLLPVPHQFPCSSIDWTTVFCIGLYSNLDVLWKSCFQPFVPGVSVQAGEEKNH